MGYAHTGVFFSGKEADKGLKKLLRRAAAMGPDAYRIQKLSVVWACILLMGALLLLERAFPLTTDTYGLFRTAAVLMDVASSVLLVGVVGAVCIEERTG